jgi:copper homeostasis protein
MAVLTEVCVDSAGGARAAWNGGADRLELCAALETGGLTPSRGLQETVVGVTDLPVHVLVRPRQGDFCYDSGEIAAMGADIRFALDGGASAVVIGALTAGGEVDRDVTARLMEAAGGAPVTFNRAFDLVENQPAALDVLLELGIGRVLTSGGRRTAAEGAPRLAELVRRGGDDIVILAGAGITPVNAGGLVRTSGVREIHFSARQPVPATLRFRNPDVVLGVGEVRLGRTSAGAVAATIAAVHDL